MSLVSLFLGWLVVVEWMDIVFAGWQLPVETFCVVEMMELVQQ